MKGQTAVEYLMTYGWAILIILIVAGVLAYYGIFSPSGFLAPTARGFGQLQVRSPWSVTSTGTVNLDIENRVGQTINVQKIYATVGTVSGVCDVTGAPVAFTSGEHKIISCAPTPNVGGVLNSQYTATISIEYETIANPGTWFNSTGTISGTY
jgi:hypothetical protein